MSRVNSIQSEYLDAWTEDEFDHQINAINSNVKSGNIKIVIDWEKKVAKFVRNNIKRFQGFIDNNCQQVGKLFTNLFNEERKTVTRGNIQDSITFGGVTQEWERELNKMIHNFFTLQFNPYMARIIQTIGQDMSKRIQNVLNKMFIDQGFMGPDFVPYEWRLKKISEDVIDLAAMEEFELKRVVNFRPVTDRILQFIDQEAGKLIENITYEQLNMIREKLRKSVTEGVNIQNIIDDITQNIGLTMRQQRSLDKIVKNMVAAGVTPGRVAQKKRTIAKRMELYRRERIARTELARAYNFAEYESTWQTIDAGIVKEAWKVWRTSMDSRVRDAHVDMEGDRVKINEDFSNGSAFPCDINERCIVDYELIEE